MSPDVKPEDPTPQAHLTLDDATRETIRIKACQVAQRVGLTRSDRPDLEQDITLHVWRRLGRFDPAKTDDSAVFVRMLVAHAVATVLRGCVRLARRAPASLEAALRHAADRPLEPLDHHSPRREQQTALSLDVKVVLARLPRQLQRVARSLQTRSISATARHLRVSRTEVYRRLAELREAFAQAGLDENL